MGIPWYENLIWEKEHQDFLKGLYREQLTGAVFDPHDGSDGDGSMCRSHILPADKNIVTSSRVKCGVIFVSSGDVATFQSRNAQSYG